MRFFILIVTAYLVACDNRPTWDLDQPFYVSTAWNLPQPATYVDGVKTVITALGGQVREGGGPGAAYAPPGAQVIHIWDASAGHGECDAIGKILGYADFLGVHICHNPAVFAVAFDDAASAARGARITGMHETLHLGGLSWHWDCAALGNNFRIMGATRECEIVDAPTEYDLNYACAGGLFVGGDCTWRRAALLEGPIIQSPDSVN